MSKSTRAPNPCVRLTKFFLLAYLAVFGGAAASAEAEIGAGGRALFKPARFGGKTIDVDDPKNAGREFTRLASRHDRCKTLITPPELHLNTKTERDLLSYSLCDPAIFRLLCQAAKAGSLSVGGPIYSGR